MHIFLNLSRIRHADHKPTGWGWRQTARAIHRTKGKRLTRPDRTDVVTRTIVVTKGIVHVEATRRKSHHSNHVWEDGRECGMDVGLEGGKGCMPDGAGVVRPRTMYARGREHA